MQSTPSENLERLARRTAIIERVRKLRAMTTERGASEAEAVAAAKAIERLVAEFQLEESELTIKADAMGCILDTYVIMHPKRESWLNFVSDLIRMYSVRCYSVRETQDPLGMGLDEECLVYKFFGFPEDVAAVIATFGVVHVARNQGLAAYLNETKKAKRSRDTTAWDYGFGLRISEQIREIWDAKRRQAYLDARRGALIVLKDSEVKSHWQAFLDENGLRLRSAKPYSQGRSAEARGAGYAAAKKVDLSGGRKVGETKKLGA